MSVNLRTYGAAAPAVASPQMIPRPLTPPRTRVQVVSRPTTPVKRVPANVCRAVVNACSALESVAAGVPSAVPMQPTYKSAVEPGKENWTLQPRLAESASAPSRGGVLLGPQDPTAGMSSKSPARSQVLGPWVCQTVGPTVESQPHAYNAHANMAIFDGDVTSRRGAGMPGKAASPRHAPFAKDWPAASESPRPVRVVSPRGVRLASPRPVPQGSPRRGLRSSPLRNAQFHISAVPVGSQQAEPAAASTANRRGFGAFSPQRKGIAHGTPWGLSQEAASAPAPPGAPRDTRNGSPVSIIAAVSGWGRKEELAAASSRVRSASVEQQHVRRVAESQLREPTPPCWRPMQHLGAAQAGCDREPQEQAVAKPPRLLDWSLQQPDIGFSKDKLRSLAEAIDSLKAEISIARLSVAEQELREAANSRSSGLKAKQQTTPAVQEQPPSTSEEKLGRPSPASRRARSKSPAASPEQPARGTLASPEQLLRTCPSVLAERVHERINELTDGALKEVKPTKKEPPAKATSLKQAAADDINGDTGGTIDAAALSSRGERTGASARISRSASASRLPARQRSKSPKRGSMLADLANGVVGSEAELSTTSKKLFWRDIIARCSSDIDLTVTRGLGEYSPVPVPIRQPVCRRRSCPVITEDRGLEAPLPSKVQTVVEKCQRLRQKASGSPNAGARATTPNTSPKMGQRTMRPESATPARKDAWSSPKAARRRCCSESPPENWRELGLFQDQEEDRTPKASSARSLPSRTHLGIERPIEHSSSPSGSKRPVKDSVEKVLFGSPMDSAAGRNVPVAKQGEPPDVKQSTKYDTWLSLNARYQAPHGDIEHTFKKGPGQFPPKIGPQSNRRDNARSNSPERRSPGPGTRVHFNAKESRVSWREEADVAMMAAIGRNHEAPPFSPPPDHKHDQTSSAGYKDPPSRQSSSKTGPERLFSTASTSSMGLSASVLAPTEEASSSASTFLNTGTPSRGASQAGSLTTPSTPARVLTADSSLRISKKLAAFLSDSAVYSKRLSGSPTR